MPTSHKSRIFNYSFSSCYKVTLRILYCKPLHCKIHFFSWYFFCSNATLNYIMKVLLFLLLSLLLLFLIYVLSSTCLLLISQFFLHLHYFIILIYNFTMKWEKRRQKAMALLFSVPFNEWACDGLLSVKRKFLWKISAARKVTVLKPK